MSIPGYDAWKLMSPYDENPHCEHCGASERSTYEGWRPDCCTGECGIRWRDPDAEYEAMRDDREACKSYEQEMTDQHGPDLNRNR